MKLCFKTNCFMNVFLIPHAGYYNLKEQLNIYVSYITYFLLKE